MRGWDEQLRARGYRVTPQRQLVLEAVAQLDHATPEEIGAQVQQTARGVNISTIYRTLELLEQIGMVTHTHLGHGAPIYHLATDADHVHLVCRDCGRVTEIGPDAIRPLITALEERHGFETDVGHLTVFGRCADCRTAADAGSGASCDEGRRGLRAPGGEREAEQPLLAWPGAVEASWPDEGVRRALRRPDARAARDRGVGGLVDRSNRGVVRITGPDRLSWLHSLTTQELDGLAAGASAQALVLSPNGHVEHHLTLTDDGTAVWVHMEPGTAAALVEFLESMRFMLRVEVADVSQDYAVLTVLGPARRRSRRRARRGDGERETGPVRHQ